jgi:protein SCO1
MKSSWMLPVVAALLAAPHPVPADPPDPHAGHHALKRATRSTAGYVVPPIELLRDDGRMVSLPSELDDGRPVVLEFVYTTCTSICPILSGTLSQLQTRLAGDRDRVHLVSISIDPEQDTPEILREYGRRYRAGPQWRFYTGTPDAIVAVQRAFGAYRGDKMSHTPVTFLRVAPGQPWVRIDGFASSEELAAEFHALLATR